MALIFQLNGPYDSIKNNTYKYDKYQHYCVSTALSDETVSLIGINYNTCTLILNENATKINIPLKPNQCMPENAG